MEKNWVEQQEDNTLFKGADAAALATHMLKISNTNRIVTAEQSRLLVAVRMMRMRLSDGNGAWDWLGRMADMVEEYQLTIGEPKNAREAFAEVLKVELQAQVEKAKSRLLGI